MSMCCISTTKRIYYCECSILSQRFAAKSAVVVAVVVGQASSNLVQCLASTSLEQYLGSGTVSDIRNSGTTMA